MLNHFPVSFETQLWSLSPEVEAECRRKMILGFLACLQWQTNKALKPFAWGILLCHFIKMTTDHVASTHSLSGLHTIVLELFGTLMGLRRRGTEGGYDDQGPQEHLLFLKELVSIITWYLVDFISPVVLLPLFGLQEKILFFPFPMCPYVIWLFIIIFLNSLYLEAWVCYFYFFNVGHWCIENNFTVK